MRNKSLQYLLLLVNISHERNMLEVYYFLGPIVRVLYYRHVGNLHSLVDVVSSGVRFPGCCGILGHLLVS
jgi:hypothetical protein